MTPSHFSPNHPTLLVNLVRCFAWASGTLSPLSLWTALDLAHEFHWPEREHARWLIVGPPSFPPDPKCLTAEERRSALHIGQRFANSLAPDSAELYEVLRALLTPNHDAKAARAQCVRSSSACARSPKLPRRARSVVLPEARAA